MTITQKTGNLQHNILCKGIIDSIEVTFKFNHFIEIYILKKINDEHLLRKR